MFLDCTLDRFEGEFADRHLLHGVVSQWAALKPDAPAVINFNRRQTLTYGELDARSAAIAGQLWRMGFRKGDFLATSLPLTNEHVLLEYACFRIGVIHAPLDLRLQPAEVERCLGLIRAKGHACTGGGLLEEALKGGGPAPEVEISENDGAQVIFTTGSTGSPKPALLSHRGITCQNFCLGAAFEFARRSPVLVNLPPSHVGSQAEELMTALYWGGTAVTLDVFDAAKSLEAIQELRVRLIGQIPAMYQLQWRLAGFSAYDLSSLELAVCGGQQAGRAFLEKLAAMAPEMGTGLGLTEASGFCTYTRPGASVEEIAASIGHAMPVYPMTIRKPMREDGAAGEELPDGEVGMVCFRGPQTFLGYVNDPEATRKTISSDGYLYTGDMGYKDELGLHFSGRAKWVIKPAGNQVFPGDVENHICALAEKVSNCGVVGAGHKLWSEGIIAFVEKKPGVELDPAELRRHARTLTSYMRPLHYVILEPGALPLNRAAKVDYVKLSEMAKAEAEALRARGRWDG